MIRKGANRVVLLLGPFAVKFPRASNWQGLFYGCLNNMNEAQWSHRPGACPVLWIAPGGFVSIMRRAADLTEEEFAALDVKAFRERNKLAVEGKRDSFGKIGGKIVAVDYGWPREIAW